MRIKKKFFLPTILILTSYIINFSFAILIISTEKDILLKNIFLSLSQN